MLKTYTYNIPFATPLQTNSRTYSHRRGLILELHTDGQTYYAEATPLPGFSSESIGDILDQIKQMNPQIQPILQHKNPAEKLETLYQNYTILPALAFALDTLACQIESRQQKRSLPTYFFDDFQPELPVNALGNLNADDYIQDVETAIDQGFETIKFKIGNDFEDEYQLLKQIRSAFPNLNIRVDANQAWMINEAIKNCRRLDTLDIEYCEEPLKEITAAKIEKVSKKTALPLAIDESVAYNDEVEKLLVHTAFVILKPMVLGSFSSIFKLHELATNHHNKLIFTSSLESIIGRTITAILATGLGSQTHAHGLATGKLLADDLRSNDYITNGIFSLPEDVFSINIDTQRLKEFPTQNFNNG